MKKSYLFIKLFLIAYLLTESALASSINSVCNQYFNEETFWFGDAVNVENKGTIPFILETSTLNERFNSKVKEYGAFQCQVKIEKLSAQCLLISVRWFPGADSSGCHVGIFKNGKKIGQSEVYMSYN